MNDDIEARREALRARFPVWGPVTLSGFLARSAEKYGDRPFVITDERTASYAEIDAWATRLADGLAALGVRPGDRVGVLMANVPGSGDLCVYKTVDPLTGEDLPDGTEGELVSTGPTHMLGYWDKPEETTLALRGGWVYSGDLGVVKPDGYLRVTGRSKELYKSGGELVMPREIEDLLTRHPGVSQAYVVGVADERWGDAGCAWIVPEPGAAVDAAELIALCKEKLARFKVPKHVFFIDPADLPATPTGKVQKFRLIQRAAERIRS